MNKVLFDAFDVCVPALSINNRMFDILPFTVQMVSHNKINSPHWHDYLQIWYTVSGSWLHTINGVTYPQKAGSAAVIFPYMIHRIDTSETNLEEAIVYQISIKKNFLENNNVPFLGHSFENASFDSFYLAPHTTITGRDKQLADLICSDILAEYQNHMAMHTNKITNDIVRLLEIFAKSVDTSVNKIELAQIRTRMECIDEAMAYLLANTAKKMTIDELSSIAMMSRRTFTSAFNSTIGQTCHSYITSLRMQNAYTLLKVTDKSIAEIAAECGFFDSSHLAQVCREIYGMSPLAIRRQHGKWIREHGDEIFRASVKSMAWAPLYTEQMFEEHQISLLHY